MTDQNSQFFAILTAIGEAKQANANALGVPWTFSHMGVGDANLTDPTPARAQTRLINERRRAPLNQLSVDPTNASLIIAEQVIPPDVGGWWIKEIGLYDGDGDLVAVANCAPSFKPLLAQGTGKTQVVRINLTVTSSANVILKIDPAVVLATRQYVDQRIIEALPAVRTAGTYTKVTTDVRGVVVSGSNPTTVAGYGITDAYTKNQADSLLAAKASLKSPVFSGIPTADTASLGNKTSQLATTQFVDSTVEAALSALDLWALQPIGVPIPVTFGAAEPPTDKAYRYIKLTADDAYNAGVLSGEVVKGVAPLLVAYGRISLSGSPIYGNTVYLLNTERRYIRPGNAGSIQNDAVQNITAAINGLVPSATRVTAVGAFTLNRSVWSAGQALEGLGLENLTFDASRVARTDIETRTKNIGANYYVRIK